MNKRKGSNYERELLKLFFDSGFSGVRVAGSGSSSFPSPDLVIGRSGSSFAVEVKSTRNDFVYVNVEQINNLLQFANVFGAEPVIAVKFIGKGWKFFKPSIGVNNNTRFSFTDNGWLFNDF